MTNKEQAVLIYNKHIALASTDGRLFRKTVMDEIMVACSCTLAASATFYNNAKKAAPVEGLGRAPVAKGVRKMVTKGKVEDIVPDDECFTVIELTADPIDVTPTVVATQSFILQGDASESFDEKIQTWPHSNWNMITGLGPNPGETYKLEMGEKVIKYYFNGKLVVPAAETPTEIKPEEATA